MLAAGRLSDLLFGIDPRDPAILAAAAALVIAVAVAALPPAAWRAATVDPRESVTDAG